MKSLQHATVLFYAAQFYFLTQQALLHSVSLPSCINSLGYQVGRPAMDYRPKQGCMGKGGGEGNNASSCLTLWKLDLSTSLDEQYGSLSLLPWTWTLYLLLSTIVQTLMIFGIFIVLRKVAQWQSQIFPNIIWGPSVKEEEGEGWGLWKCVRINYNVDSPGLTLTKNGENGLFSPSLLDPPLSFSRLLSLI